MISQFFPYKIWLNYSGLNCKQVFVHSSFFAFVEPKESSLKIESVNTLSLITPPLYPPFSYSYFSNRSFLFLRTSKSFMRLVNFSSYSELIASCTILRLLKLILGFLRRSMKMMLILYRYLKTTSFLSKSSSMIPFHRKCRFLLTMTLLTIQKVAVTGRILTVALSLKISSLSLRNSYILYIQISLNPIFCINFFTSSLALLVFCSISKRQRVKLTEVSISEWQRKKRQMYAPSQILSVKKDPISSRPLLMRLIKSASLTLFFQINLPMNSLKEKLKLPHKLSRSIQLFVFDLLLLTFTPFLSVIARDHIYNRSESLPKFSLFSQMYCWILPDQILQVVQLRWRRMFRLARQVFTLKGEQSAQTERRQRLQMCYFLKTLQLVLHISQPYFTPLSNFKQNYGNITLAFLQLNFSYELVIFRIILCTDLSIKVRTEKLGQGAIRKFYAF